MSRENVLSEFGYRSDLPFNESEQAVADLGRMDRSIRASGKNALKTAKVAVPLAVGAALLATHPAASQGLSDNTSDADLIMKIRLGSATVVGSLFAWKEWRELQMGESSWPNVAKNFVAGALSGFFGEETVRGTISGEIPFSQVATEAIAVAGITYGVMTTNKDALVRARHRQNNAISDEINTSCKPWATQANVIFANLISAGDGANGAKQRHYCRQQLNSMGIPDGFINDVIGEDPGSRFNDLVSSRYQAIQKERAKNKKG